MGSFIVDPEKKAAGLFELGVVLRSGNDPTVTGDLRVLQNLRALEQSSRISPSFFSTVQTDIQPYMRRIVTEWMFEV